MADEPRLDLEMLDKLINRLDDVYLKAIQVTEKLETLSKVTIKIKFSRNFDKSLGNLNKLSNALKRIDQISLDTAQATKLINFFNTLSGIDTVTAPNVKPSSFAPVFELIESLAKVTKNNKISVSDTRRLKELFEEFSSIMDVIFKIPTGRVPLTQILAAQKAIKPILDTLLLLADLSTSGLTAGRAASLNQIMESYGELLSKISLMLKDVSNLPSVGVIKGILGSLIVFRPILSALKDIIEVASKSTIGKLGEVINILNSFQDMFEVIPSLLLDISKSGGLVSSALKVTFVILPIFNAIQDILRLLLRFRASEVKSIGQIFDGIGNIFESIVILIRDINFVDKGKILNVVVILGVIEILFRQIKRLILGVQGVDAAKISAIGTVFRGLGSILSGIAEGLGAIKNASSIKKLLGDYILLLVFLVPFFLFVKKITQSVKGINETALKTVGDIFVSLGSILRGLASFVRDSSRITRLSDAILLIITLKGIFSTIGGLVKTVVKTAQKSPEGPIGELAQFISSITQLLPKILKLISSGDINKESLVSLQETLEILPRVFNKFKIDKTVAKSLVSFVDLIKLVTDSIDFKGLSGLSSLIDTLSKADSIDISTSGLEELGESLVKLLTSVDKFDGNKVQDYAIILKSIATIAKKSGDGVDDFSEANTDLTKKLTTSIVSLRVKEEVLKLVSSAFSLAAKLASRFATAISPPALIAGAIGKLSELGDAIKGVGDDLKDLGEEIREAGSELIETFGVGALFGSTAFQDTIGFDKIGTQLQVFGNLNDDARIQAENFAFELGRKYPISAGEALDATLDLLKAGQSLEDIQFALPSIADLTALSESGDLETISGAMIQVVSVFDQFQDGVEGSFANSDVAANLLSAAADGSVSSVESLAEGLAKVGPIANVFGFNLDEVTAALGLFSNAGLEGAQAGTQLKSFLNNLQTTTAQKTLRDLSIKTTDAAGNFLSLNEIVNNINSSLNDVSTVTFVPNSPLGPEAKVRYDAATKAAASASRQLALYRDGLNTGSLDQEKANKKIADYEQVLANANRVIAEVTGSQEEADAITVEITRSQEDNAKALKDLAGSYGAVGLSILLAQGEDGLQGFIDTMNDTLPASERARLLLDNLAGDMIQLQGSVSTAMTIALLPLIDEFFRPLVLIMRFVVDGLLSMDRSVLEFIGSAVGLVSIGATIIGVFLVVAGTFLQVGGVIFIVVGTLLNLVTVMALVVGAGVALVTGFVAIVAVFSIFIPLIVLATAAFKAIATIFRDDLGGASSSAVKFFQTLGRTLKDLLSPLGAVVNFVRLIASPGDQGNILTQAGKAISSFFDRLSDGLNSGAIGNMRAFVGLISNFFAIIGTGIENGTLPELGLQFEQIDNIVTNFSTIIESAGLSSALNLLGATLDDSLGNIIAILSDRFKEMFGFNLISDELRDAFSFDGLGAGIRLAFDSLVDNLLTAVIGNRDALKGVFIKIVQFFFSPLKAVGFFAKLFGIKPLEQFVNEFNNILGTVVGGAFDLIINLLDGQSFPDAFSNAFGEGAQPLLDFILELGEAATNIGAIVSQIFSDFFGRFVAEGEDVGIISVISGVFERLTEGLSLLNDLILGPLAEGDVGKVFSNLGSLIAEGFSGIVGTFTGLLDGIDIFGIFTDIATTIITLFATAFVNAVATLGDILNIDVSSILTVIEDTLQANANVLSAGGSEDATFFATISNTIVGLFVAALQSAFLALGEFTGITFDTSGIVDSLDLLFNANLATSQQGGVPSAFNATANTIAGLFVAAINSVFTAIGGLTGVDITGIQNALTEKLGGVLDTLEDIFFGGEGETSLFDDIATIANTVAEAIQAILDAFSGDEGDPSQTTDALDSIVNFLGDLAVLSLDGITAPLIIIREFVSFLADQDAGQLIQLGVGVGAIGAGFATWSALVSIGGITGILPAITGAIISLGTAPLATIAVGITGVGTAFTAFAGSIAGKFAGIAAIFIIIKSLADNIDIFKEALQAFADGDPGEGFTTFLEGIGQTFEDIGLNTLFDLLGFDTIFGQSREEIETTINQIENMFSILGIAFSLFVETKVIAPLRRFIDIDIADIINEIRLLSEIAGDIGGGAGLLADEEFLSDLFGAEDLNISSLSNFLNLEGLSPFLLEEVRILGRKTAPELAAQLAASLNTASIEDLIKWGEIINATGIFPEIAEAVLASGGDLTPIIEAIFASGGTIPPESVQGLATIVEQSLLDNLNFENFQLNLGILESIRNSILASGGDTTAIDDVIADIKGKFETLLGDSSDDPVKVTIPIEVTPGEVVIVTPEDGGDIPTDPEIPPWMLLPIGVEAPVEITPGKTTIVTPEDGATPDPELPAWMLTPIGVDTPVEITPVEGGVGTEEITIKPETVNIDTTDSDIIPLSEDTDFIVDEETFTDPATLELINLQLSEMETNFSSLEIAFAALELSGPLAVTSITSIKEAYATADISATAFYDTLIIDSVSAQVANAAAFATINGNIIEFGNQSLISGLKYGGFVGTAISQTKLLGKTVVSETQRMTSGFQSLTAAVKVLTANLRDAIDQAQKAASAVTNINGVEPGGPGGGRAIGGRTLANGRYEITERGESEIYQEGGKTFLLASGAGNVLTMAQAFPDLSSSRSSDLPSSAMQPSSGITNITTSTIISEGDIIISITEPGASAAEIASEVQTVLAERDSRVDAGGGVSVRDKLRTNHR